MNHKISLISFVKNRFYLDHTSPLKPSRYSLYPRAFSLSQTLIRQKKNVLLFIINKNK